MPKFARGCRLRQRSAATTGRSSRVPIQLAETATAEKGGSKAQWIRDMWAYLATRPYVTSMIWFNLVKETNWRIDSSPSAERAFARRSAVGASQLDRLATSAR